MRTSLLKLSLTVSTGVDVYSEGMKQRTPSDFLKGSGLPIHKLALVAGEDCMLNLIWCSQRLWT